MLDIPAITHPLGKVWVQPLATDYVYLPAEDVVAMSEEVLSKLANYSRSLPSGVYEGKMWKRWTGRCWQLCWYSGPDPTDNDYMLIGRKDIAVC